MSDDLEIRMRLYHAVPGRIRLKIPELSKSHGLRSVLKNRLEKEHGVRSAETRPVTGSLIVRYHVDRIAQADLLEKLRFCLKNLSGKDLSTLHQVPPVPLSETPERRPSGLLGYYLLNGIVLSAFMVYVLVGRVFFRFPLRQAPLSFAGIAAMIGTVPLLRRTFRDLRRKKRMGLFPFLTITGAIFCLKKKRPLWKSWKRKATG